MTFALDLQKFAEKAEAKADELVGGVMVRLIREIDDRSPVGDRERWAINIERKQKGLSLVPKGYIGGRFRGNWQLGIGSIPAGVLSRVDADGTQTVAANVAAIPEDAAGRVFFYANNLPYARAIEDGISKVAPAGVVGVTVVQFRQIVRETAEALQ